jgi:glycosyltransferase involved in cell wall biosynthesis
MIKILLNLFFFSILFCNEKRILVVIASYNNESWADKNLSSVFNQNYSNYRVVYFNDASIDKTENEVFNIVNKFNKWDKFTYLKRSQNRGPNANRYNGYIMGQKDEIIIVLDGDDWLAHENVFQRINSEYQDQNVWSTYGQYRESASGKIGYCKTIPQDVIEKNFIRKHEWVTSHLRSFYAALPQKIKVKDLLHDGLFYSVAGDAAEQWPIVELAGRHLKFIPDVLYIYNDTNQLSEYRVHSASFIMNTASLIRSKKSYNKIDNLFASIENSNIDIIINKKISSNHLDKVRNDLFNIKNCFYFDDFNLEIDSILSKIKSENILFLNNESEINDINHCLYLFNLILPDVFVLEKIEKLTKFEKLFDPKTLLENLILYDTKFNNTKFNFLKNLFCSKSFFEKLVKNNIERELCLYLDI